VLLSLSKTTGSYNLPLLHCKAMELFRHFCDDGHHRSFGQHADRSGLLIKDPEMPD
jgi:hypothetical protein